MVAAKVKPADATGVSKVVPSLSSKQLKPLTAQQVESACNSKRRHFVTSIVCVAMFMDIAGAVILQPGVPMMMSNAKQATRPSDWPDGYRHPQAFPKDSFNGVTYPLAINLVLVVNQLAATFSNLGMGLASDKCGRKPIIIIGLFMGVVTLVLYYIAGVVMKSFWAFLAFFFLNGLFAGSRTVVSAYVKDLWGPEFSKIQPVLMIAFLLGGATGGLIGGTTAGIAKVDSISGNLFLGALVAAGISFVCLIAVLVFVPELPRVGKPVAEINQEAPPKVPKLVKRILLNIIIGSALDSFGDQGNTFARNTIFSNRYPQGKEVTVNMAMLMTKLLGVLVAMFIVLGTQKRTGLAFWLIVGNLISAACQVAISPHGMPFAGFIAIWTFAQLFGFTSTMAANFLVPQFAPPESIGFWMGLNNSAFTFGMTAAPLMLSGIYTALAPSAGSPASEYQDAEFACLFTCGSISFIAFLCYLPLPRLMPTGTQVAPVEEKPMDVYEQMSAKDWSRVPASEQYLVNLKRAQEGKPPIASHWLLYKDDLEDGGMDNLIERSRGEFLHIRNNIKGILTNRAKLVHVCEDVEHLRDNDKQYDREKESRAMGAWLADYLDDAGFHHWIRHPDLFKAMMMNAFPPIDALDGKKFTFTDVEELEVMLLNWLRVLDAHVHQQQVTASIAGIRNFGNWLSRVT